MAELPAVLVEQLHVRLGKTEVLRGVDLRIERGDLYGLLGRNGAGKTTSLRALLGLLPQAHGRCQVFGTSSEQLSACPEPIGVALDPPGLDDTLTVKENLELARIRSGAPAGRSVDEALDLVGMSHRAHHRGDRLSHGQGRRAAVARALLGSPQLLLLDEPLSGLDPEGVEVLLGLFRHLSSEENVTVVLSSHHLREVEAVCTRVGMIEAGQTLLEGKVHELLHQAGDGLRVRCQDTQRCMALLNAIEQVREVREASDGYVHAQVDDGFDYSQALSQLVVANCGVAEFARDRASLVDVFQNALARASEAAPAEARA